MSVEVMSGGGGSPKLQTKTVSSSTSSQNVVPDSGYDGLSKVTVNAMSTGSLNEISVNSNGLITSTVGTSGYLSSGTSKTLQLSTQGPKTITPTTYSQTAISSGKYTTGNIYVNGDSNLTANNIRSGVSIFNILGNYTGDGNYKAFFGTINPNSTSAYLTLPTSGEYITTDKIKAIIIWTVEEPSTLDGSTPIFLWIYAPFISSAEVKIDSGDGISTYYQNIYTNPQYGYIQAGFTTANWFCFYSLNYTYIILANT